MILLIPLVPLFQCVLWLAAIRPYCLRNGKGHTKGANWGVTIWVDWQQAGETAKERGDHRMILICRLFLVLQLLFFAAICCLIAAKP